MTKGDPPKPNFKVHVMPPSITDADITALFNGIINVVKKKVELEKMQKLLTWTCIKKDYCKN